MKTIFKKIEEVVIDKEQDIVTDIKSSTSPRAEQSDRLQWIKDDIHMYVTHLVPNTKDTTDWRAEQDNFNSIVTHFADKILMKWF